MKTQTSGDHDLKQRGREGSPSRPLQKREWTAYGKGEGTQEDFQVSTQYKRVVGGASSLAWGHRG